MSKTMSSIVGSIRFYAFVGLLTLCVHTIPIIANRMDGSFNPLQEIAALFMNEPASAKDPSAEYGSSPVETEVDALLGEGSEEDNLEEEAKAFKLEDEKMRIQSKIDEVKSRIDAAKTVCDAGKASEDELKKLQDQMKKVEKNVENMQTKKKIVLDKKAKSSFDEMKKALEKRLDEVVKIKEEIEQKIKEAEAHIEDSSVESIQNDTIHTLKDSGSHANPIRDHRSPTEKEHHLLETGIRNATNQAVKETSMHHSNQHKNQTSDSGKVSTTNHLSPENAPLQSNSDN